MPDANLVSFQIWSDWVRIECKSESKIDAKCSWRPFLGGLGKKRDGLGGGSSDASLRSGYMRGCRDDDRDMAAICLEFILKISCFTGKEEIIDHIISLIIYNHNGRLQNTHVAK